MASVNQYDDVSPSLNAGIGDARLRKKSAVESQKSTFRGLANFKDKVIATISGSNENSDSETNADLRVRAYKAKGIVETTAGSKSDSNETEQPQRQKTPRTIQKSIPIVLKADIQQELSSVMDDRPPVPAKNHARPQIQHKPADKRGRPIEPNQEQRQNQLEELVIKLQEELRRAKEQAYQAEKDALRGCEIQEELSAQIENLISHHEEQILLLSKELSRAHEQLNKDQTYQTMVSEHRISERNESVLRSKIKLLTQDLATLKTEAKRVIQENKAEAAESRAELQRRELEHDELVARVEEQRDQAVSERDRVRQQLDRVVQQLASQTSLDVYHFDDLYFQSQFISLRGNIKDWAHRAFCNGQFTNDRRPSLVAENVFASITTHWVDYLCSDEHRPTIMQAFVWTYLITKVLGGAWTWPKEIHPFGQLSKRCLEQSESQLVDLQLYHEWRSTGARLVVPQGRERDALEEVSTLLKDTADTIQNYLEPWSTMGKAQSNGMLLKILKEAVQLDIKIQQQMASFALLGADQLLKQDSGLYNPDTMEVRYGKASDGKLVELLIAPLLLKRGTSDGQDYHITVVIEKAQVDTAVPPKKGKGLLKMVR